MVDEAEPSGERDRILVRAQMGLATAEFERGSLEVALDWLARATETAERTGDPELQTLCLSQRATVLGRSGDIAGARSVMTRALAGLDALASRDQSVLLMNYGIIQLFAGDLAGAWESFRRSAEIAAAHGHDREAFGSRFNQGYVAFLRGDLPSALSALQQAESAGVDVSGAVTRLDRGRVLLEAGLLSEALEVLEEGARLATSQPQRQILGEIEVELARTCVLLGRFGEARTWADRARRRFNRRSAPVWAARAELIKGQADLLSGHRVRAAWRTAEKVSTHVAAGDWILNAEHRLIAAEAAWASGEVERAREHVAAVERLNLRLPLRARLQAAHLRALLAQHDGQPGRARRILDNAARVLVREQAGSASIDLRAAISMYSAPLTRLHLQLVPFEPRALFECTERWRASSQRLQPVRPPEDETQASLLASLREVRMQLRSEPLGATRQELLKREYELSKAVRERAWAWRSSVGAVLEVSYSATRARLAEQDAELLSLFVHDERMLALHLGPGRSRVHDLGPAERIVELARRVVADLDVAGRFELGDFSAQVWAGLRRSMAELDSLVLRGRTDADRRLVIVPHRYLAALPWAMAPSLRGRPVVVAPSATDWTARSDLAPTRAGRSPVVEAAAGPGLAHADAEIAAIARAWPGAGVSGAAQSTVDRVRAAFAEADVVHVAAHGRHNPQNPMFASVQLAEGPVFVYDLEQGGMGARHVVLSACEVGQSAVRPGDEPVGLAAGLLRLGAQSVLAGVSRVPDDVSAALMADYHRVLAGGVAADEALARVIADHGDGLGGAFVLFGASWRAPQQVGT